MITITVYNKKGGIGKTTIVQHLAVALAMLGYKVGVIDMDGQGHQKKCYIFNESSTAIDLKKAILKKYDDKDYKLKIEDFYSTNTPNLWVMTNNKNINSAVFAHFEFGDVPYVLQNMLPPIFDFVIIDCPPSLDAPTVNALVASDFVLSPVEYSAFGLDSLDQLLINLEAAKKFNPKLVHLGIFGTKVIGNRKLVKMSKERIDSRLKHLILDCDISTNEDFGKAHDEHLDIFKYDGKNKLKGTEQINRLRNIVLQKIKTILTSNSHV